MRSKLTIHPFIFSFTWFAFSLLYSTVSFGADESYINSLKGQEIANGSRLSVQDGLYNYMAINNNWENRPQTFPPEVPFTPGKIFTNTAINGYISLRWEGSEDEAYTTDWYYKVEVRIYSWEAGGNPLPTIDRTLTIDYGVARQESYKDWDVFNIPGANKIRVDVLAISYSQDGINYSTLPNNQIDKEDLYLEAKVMVERNYQIDMGLVPTLNQDAINASDRTVTYSWPHLWGAEEYDFEWLFVSDQLADIPGTSNPYTYGDVLDWENASRVSLSHNQYTLELPYESGRVYFRVRAVGYGNPLKARTVSNWGSNNGTEYIDINNSSTIQPLEIEKNWTYSANYAEQGKRVESLTFADGTGRGRQSVTKDNSNDRAIVAETVFDREGRQSMQVIPSVAPEAQNQMNFHNNYNTNLSGTPVHWTDFDQDVHYNQLATPIKLSENSGASQYFSASNNDLVGGTSIANFIPHADGMPYTRTVFDKQGRVLRQGGVGEEHSVGNGHDTRYFYAAAQQTDLDELFGSEIGYAEHYAMQMTIDPNGQRSISYTNLSGKTVATALIGVAPTENGDPLVDDLDHSGYNYSTVGRNKTTDLSPFNDLERAENTASWVVRREFMVTSEGDYEFSYSPFTGVYNQCIPNQDDDCDFELRINFYDSEGNNVTGDITIDGLLSTNTGTAPSYLGTFFNISQGEFLEFTFTAGADDIGSYTIVKELRLKDVTTKVETFYANLLAYKIQYQDYLSEYYETYQYNLINDPDIGLPTPPTAPPCIDFGNYVEAAGDWLNPCFVSIGTGTSDHAQNYCIALQSILEQDLLPGGQYFDNNESQNDPNGWLTNNVWDFSTSGSITYNGVVYNSWDEIRTLSMVDIEILMRNETFFEEHPEWGIYQNRCLDNIDPISGNSWYEDFLQQDTDWLEMDLADAQTANYFNIPESNGNAIICNSPPSGPNTSTNDLNSYSMFNEALVLNSGSAAYDATLRERVCNCVSWDDGNTTGYHDIAAISNLPTSNPLEDRQWQILRAMMMQAKQWAVDAHTNNLGNCCAYLVDADPNDNEYKTTDGFHIRIPSYESISSQLQNNTGISSADGNVNNIDINGNSVDQTQLDAYANSVIQDYSLCDYYEVSMVHDCIAIDNGYHGSDLEFYLDFSSSSLSSIYGNELVLFVAPYDFTFCYDYIIDDHQDEINLNVANFPAPLNTDIEVIVKSPTTSNNPNALGSVEIVVRFPGAAYNNSSGLTADNTYQNIRLVKRHVDNQGSAILDSLSVEYVDCDDQDYTICVCEEIKQFDQYFTELINNGSMTGDVYTAIANKYNTDLNPTTSITASDVQYLMEGYCGYGDVYAPAFTDFAVPSTDPPAAHLPIAAYPIGSADNYQQWKDIFLADPNIHAELHEAMSSCLEINSGLSCQEEALALAIFNASEQLDAAALEQKEAYRRMLLNNCMIEPAEIFEMTYTDYSMHHTLYYYDASGNLQKTVPPTGVAVLNTQQDLQNAGAIRDNNDPSVSPLEPAHRLETTYKYNTLNNVVSSEAPDRGEVITSYDKLGRAIFTQNAQQQANGEASYVIYDGLGRITETGVTIENAATLSFATYKTTTNFQTDLDEGNFPNSLVDNSGWTKKEVRTTTYNSSAFSNLFEATDNILRNRVGTQSYSMDGNNYDYRVGYNYDVFGNAQEVWQQHPHLLGNTFKQLKYDYDLISGVVHRVDYQQGHKDQLSFQYDYDANNRLIEAISSTDGFIWNTDAHYEYYLHGPLKRVEIGENKVQGIDYVYTMHGWIKGVNSNQLQSMDDPGNDGDYTLATGYAEVHDRVAKDVFGYAVHYYEGDYKSIDVNKQGFSVNPTGTGNLYNGNISSVTQAQTKPALGGAPQQNLPFIWKRYRYDLLHRITKAQTEENTGSASWTGSNWANITPYETNYSYGPNGNILSLNRYDGSSTQIDQLTYSYSGLTTPTSAPTQFENNQLLRVQDGIPFVQGRGDVSTQPSVGANNNQQNYLYDLNGSLTKDRSEEIENIEWTSEKKIQYLEREATSDRSDLQYIYDFQGNRIAKVEIPSVSTQKERHQVYVRDPQGNILAIYEYLKPQDVLGYYQPVVHLKEQMIYGSDRLATLKRNVQTGGPIRILGNGRVLAESTEDMTLELAINGYLEHIESDPSLSYEAYTDTVRDSLEVIELEILREVSIEEWEKRSSLNPEWASTVFESTAPVVKRLERVRGQVRYELKNFRGDIRQIISDVKYRELDGNGLVAYTADVYQVEDSYPFGWSIKERSFSVDQYRFGFNGMEKNPEQEGSYTTEYRQYDGRVGRFTSVDPAAELYYSWSAYSFSLSNPLANSDPTGATVVLGATSSDGTSVDYHWNNGSLSTSDGSVLWSSNDNDWSKLNQQSILDEDKSFIKDVVGVLEHLTSEEMRDQNVGEISFDVLLKGQSDKRNYGKGHAILDFTEGGKFYSTEVRIYNEEAGGVCYCDPEYNGSAKVIGWNPDQGLRFPNQEQHGVQQSAGAISPSTILLHEFGHAWLWQVNPKLYSKIDQVSQGQPPGGTPWFEEHTMKIERHASQVQGQGERFFYGSGEFFETESVNSVEPRK